MNNIITLRKIGGFYICFDNDAIIISYLCNYKIKNGKVGFPINTINKITNILNDNNISYIVKEEMEEVDKKIYGKKNKYKYYLEKGINKINLDKRINNIINKVNNLEEKELIKLLDVIEDNI